MKLKNYKESHKQFSELYQEERRRIVNFVKFMLGVAIINTITSKKNMMKKNRTFYDKFIQLESDKFYCCYCRIFFEKKRILDFIEQ